MSSNARIDTRPASGPSGQRASLTRRSVRWAGCLWVLANVGFLVLAPDELPFDRPVVSGESAVDQVLSANVGMLAALVLIAVVHRLTRARPAPDFRSRVPDRDRARRETLGLLGYGVLAQLGGAALGTLLGWPAISFHLTGTLYGTSDAVEPSQVFVWAAYNLLVYAVVPFIVFRRRYSAEALGLRSADRRGDAWVIGVVLILESAFQLLAFSAAILHLHGAQLLAGIPLTFGFYFAGTVLPTMIFVYALLVPRFLRLTGSGPVTVMLGGLTYALLHILDGWTDFGSLRDGVLSTLAVLLLYLGPGMVKTVLTLRTGNSWVHVWAYHAIAPHVLQDSGLMVHTFGLH